MTELARDVGEYAYKILYGQERELRCLEKARIWLASKYAFCHRDITKINDQDPVIREIIIKRAAYELYSMAEQEETARDKKEDALELLAGILGPAVFQSTFTQPASPLPVPAQTAAVKQQTKTRWDAYGQ